MQLERVQSYLEIKLQIENRETKYIEGFPVEV